MGAAHDATGDLTPAPQRSNRDEDRSGLEGSQDAASFYKDKVECGMWKGVQRIEEAESSQWRKEDGFYDDKV